MMMTRRAVQDPAPGHNTLLLHTKWQGLKSGTDTAEHTKAFN